jgi:hypothetical protein
LPFRPGTIDFFFATAVFEHLRQPFQAANEVYQILKPGGYVYADCNFIFPYHGYPHHYFNASVHGMRQIFAAFREMSLGVAPFQMPSFTMGSLLQSYLDFFQNAPSCGDAAPEAEVIDLLKRIRAIPLHRFDAKFGPDLAFRLAAGEYFVGIKQPTGKETVVPRAVMEVYEREPALRQRFPDPARITGPDNLFRWARTEGRGLYPDILNYFNNLKPFSKYTDPTRPLDRSKMHGYSLAGDLSGFQVRLPGEENSQPQPTTGANPGARSAIGRALEKIPSRALRGFTRRFLNRLRT